MGCRGGKTNLTPDPSPKKERGEQNKPHPRPLSRKEERGGKTNLTPDPSPKKERGEGRKNRRDVSRL